MKEVKITNYHEALRTATPDHEGTLVAKLIDLPVGMVVEEIPPSLAIAPHYHDAGDDFFMILSGECTLYLADLADDKKTHLNPRRIQLKPGDTYAVPPKVIHGIESNHSEKIVIANIAPQTHTTTDIFYV